MKECRIRYFPSLGLDGHALIPIVQGNQRLLYWLHNAGTPQ